MRFCALLLVAFMIGNAVAAPTTDVPEAAGTLSSNDGLTATPEKVPKNFDALLSARRLVKRQKSGGYSPSIEYKAGGKVLTGTRNLYVIQYGTAHGQYDTNSMSWLGPDLPLLVGEGSSWFKSVQKYYYQASETSEKVNVVPPKFVKYVVAFAKTGTDPYPLGKNLTNQDIQTIILHSIASEAVPQDPMGIYIVVVSDDVQVTRKSGSITSGLFGKTGDPAFGFCGYHGMTLKYNSWSAPYIVVGDPSASDNVRCFNKALFSIGSNKDPCPSLALASTVAGLIAQTLTNPDLKTGWHDGFGHGIADVCAGTYGTTSVDPLGRTYNVVSDQGDEFKYLVQQIWDPVLKKCASNFVPPCGGPCSNGQPCLNLAPSGSTPVYSCGTFKTVDSFNRRIGDFCERGPSGDWSDSTDCAPGLFCATGWCCGIQTPTDERPDINDDWKYYPELSYCVDTGGSTPFYPFSSGNRVRAYSDPFN